MFIWWEFFELQAWERESLERRWGAGGGVGRGEERTETVEKFAARGR